jgi:hypothetical protein
LLFKEKIYLRIFTGGGFEARRNFVAAWGYYTLKTEGMDKDEAPKHLKGKKNGKSTKCFLREESTF